MSVEGRFAMFEQPMKCKCGADARIRRKGEYIWVECSSKKCDMHSGFIHFVHDNKVNVEDFATDSAIRLWNKVVCKSTQG